MSGPCATKRVQHALDLFVSLASLNLTKAIQLKGHTEWPVNDPRFSSFTHEHVHMKEVEFTAYDQSQTWTVHISGSGAACFQYEEQTNNLDEKQLQPSDAGRSEKKSLTVWLRKTFNINVKIIIGTNTHGMSARSQKCSTADWRKKSAH